MRLVAPRSRSRCTNLPACIDPFGGVYVASITIPAIFAPRVITPPSAVDDFFLFFFSFRKIQLIFTYYRISRKLDSIINAL